jgi:hypothetical protein
MNSQVDFVWRYVNRTGLYLKHKELRPTQILELYGLEVVQADNDEGWRVQERADQAKARRHEIRI